MRSLAEWLAWQERLHPAEMALGLERVQAVLARLGLSRPPFTVVTVAGTNGKGSTVAFLERMLCSGGHRVGAYSSPHVFRYTERVRIDGEEIDEMALCRAFQRVEEVRGDIPLTYFEYGTLGALVAFSEAGVELAVLEVGLGGRLDAVNAVDPQLSVITPVDLDHQQWLGPDREAIGAEKAGILRPGVPLVLGDPDPPASVIARAEALAVPLHRLGLDYALEPAGPAGWCWRGPGDYPPVRTLGLEGAHQADNAATALMALHCLSPHFPVDPIRAVAALAETRLPGRQQRLPGAPEWLVDVGHNPHAARALARRLAADPRPTVAVVALLADKDPHGFLAPLLPYLEGLHLAGLPGTARGAAAGDLAEAVGGQVEPDGVHPSVVEALEAALARLPAQGRLLVCGSFHTVAEALAWRGERR